MFEIIKSAAFDAWLSGLRDVRAKARINARITRMQTGNLGDVKTLGDGLHDGYGSFPTVTWRLPAALFLEWSFYADRSRSVNSTASLRIDSPRKAVRTVAQPIEKSARVASPM